MNAGANWRPLGCAPLFASMNGLHEAATVLAASAGAPGTNAGKHWDWPRATPPAEMRVSALPTGVIESRAALAFQGGTFGDRRRFALNAVLVRHPRGNLLFDTGIGSQWPKHRAALPWLMRKTTRVLPGRPAADQLAFGRADALPLSGIVLTHAHWDHISGVADFPGVPVWMDEAERRFVDSGHRSMAVARRVDAAALQALRLDDGPCLGFSRSLDLWSDGSVVLVPAPGHTPGSIIAFISLPSGRRLALIGDIVWQMEGIEREVERPWLSRMLADHSPAELRRLITVLSALHRQHPEVWLIPAHDERAMNRLPRWPDALG